MCSTKKEETKKKRPAIQEAGIPTQEKGREFQPWQQIDISGW